MHSAVGNAHEDRREDAQTNRVARETINVEAEAADDSRAWDFNVEAVLVICEG